MPEPNKWFRPLAWAQAGSEGTEGTEGTFRTQRNAEWQGRGSGSRLWLQAFKPSPSTEHWRAYLR